LPELPEIEAIRRGLGRVLVGAAMRLASVGPHDMRARGRGRRASRSGPWITPEQALDRAKVIALHRQGKQLAIEARDGRVLVLQLGMSGQVRTDRDAPASHRHLEWQVRSARGASFALVFRDPRRFGGVSWWPSMQALREGAWTGLGPDALSITGDVLHARLSGIRAVKAALLDQAVLAGVGNIYADEALFAAGIHPRRRARTVTADECAALAAALRRTLADAVRRNGSTLRDHVGVGGSPGTAQHAHRAYGRAGSPCSACGTPMSSGQVAGRTTCWCDRCQPRRPARRSGSR
jgi:formamidopyrimidine-DNA glycosylase